MHTTLTRIFIVLESVSHGLSENSDEISRRARKFEDFFSKKKKKKKKKKIFAEIATDFSAEIRNSKVFSVQNQVVSKKKLRLISRPKSEIQRFFPPKIRWSPKKKKKKVFAGIETDFSAQFGEIQTFEGGLFSYGEPFSIFPQIIGLKSTKNVRFCILHKPIIGGSSPPRPPLATLLRMNM